MPTRAERTALLFDPGNEDAMTAAILRLADLGALVQLTAMSVTGEFGERAQRCCRLLLDCGCVHFIASDAHDLKERPPRLRRAREMVAQGWGEEVARLLFQENPAAVLADRPLGEAGLGVGAAVCHDWPP